MFKKFKDKIAEEMKQSPARLQASMQQLAQAVVSPAPSNSSIQELSASNDNFSIIDEKDETPQNSPAKHGFQDVNLITLSSNAMGISRKSSENSIVSDTSSLFPVYESPTNLYHLQSDVDQSASEIDDNINPQLDRVTKEQLYSAYRKVQSKYHKYRGRYSDLTTHYRELERAKSKLESVLVETQDKVLRRIADLKEQCQLEQQAKAHLEEVLRNDIEEKDHIINTLCTKIKLLQSSGPSSENVLTSDLSDQKDNLKTDLIDLSNESTVTVPENSDLCVENEQLKDKLKKLENLVFKYKDSLKRNKTKCVELMEEKNILESNYASLQRSSEEDVQSLREELKSARVEVDDLKQQVNVLKKREEESVISLAENKLSIHRELECKEEQIKQLQLDLKQTVESKDNLNEILERYKAELNTIKSSLNNSHNFNLEENVSKHKLNALQNVQQEIQEKTTCSEKTVDVKGTAVDNKKAEGSNDNINKKLTELDDLKIKLNELETLCEAYHGEKEKLQNELLNLKTTYKDLKNENDALKIVTEEKRKETEMTIENLQATVHNLDKELENMRNALTDRDRVCETYNIKIQEYSNLLEKSKESLCMRDTEIKNLKSRINDNQIIKLNEEIENKNAELFNLHSELDSCKSTISDLTEKLTVDKIKIDSLNEKRKCMISNITKHKSMLQELRENYDNLRKLAEEKCADQSNTLSVLNSTINDYFTNFIKEDNRLRDQIENYEKRLEDHEQLKTKQIELETELTNMIKLKDNFEMELKKCKVELERMTVKEQEHKELCENYNTLNAKVNCLKLKILDAENMQCQTEETKLLINGFKEQLQTFSEESSEESRTEDGADKIIQSIRSECNELQSKIPVLMAEISSLKNCIAEKDDTIKMLNEKLINENQTVAMLKTKCEEHIALLDENSKQITELVDSNKAQQETIRTKNLQLKKLKTVKENQAETIKDITNKLEKLKTEHLETSEKLQNSEKEINELKEENCQATTLKDMNLRITSELEKLKTIETEMTSENKALKHKENELTKLNQELQKAIEEKNVNYEKDKQHFLDTIEIVRKESESYRIQLLEQNEKLEKLNKQLNEAKTELQSKDKMLEEQNEKLMTREKELQEIKLNFGKQNEEYNKVLQDLNEALKESERMQNQNKLLSVDMETLKTQNNEFNTTLNENATLKSKLDDFNDKMIELENIKVEYSKSKTERENLENKLAAMENISKENSKLQTDLNNLQIRISELEQVEQENTALKMSVENQKLEKEKQIENLTNELSELKNILEEKVTELNLLDTKNTALLQELEKSNFQFSQSMDEKIKETETLKNAVKELEDKYARLESEIVSLNEEKDTLHKELETVNNHNVETEDLTKKSDKLQEQNKKLEAQLDEVLITFQAKESQMQLMNNELKSQADQLKEEIKTNEEEQTMRLKQLVKEFQAQLHDKEEELQAALEKRFDYQKNYESDLIQQYKEQLKDVQAELIVKSEQVESLLLENKDMTKKNDEKLNALLKTIENMKKDHSNEIKEIEKKWKTIVQQRTEKLEMKHDDEINELTKEWHNERRSGAQINTESKELESTSRVAMAAVQSNTDSFHTLQQTLVSQRRELAELRKLVKLRNDSLEDSTEIEYLRNILFEYMMGRETMVLARVIAAVVKFDQQQTTKILKKEEDKLTLLGSLGII